MLGADKLRNLRYNLLNFVHRLNNGEMDRIQTILSCTKFYSQEYSTDIIVSL